jgi:hypothetical protein
MIRILVEERQKKLDATLETLVYAVKLMVERRFQQNETQTDEFMV